MRTMRFGGLVGVWLLLPPVALAWDHKGHMAVAYLAYQQLGAASRARVYATLKAHPDFTRLAQRAGGPTSGDFQVKLFVQAARWPDFIRDDPRFYDDTDPHAVPTKRLAGFPDMKQHRPWHYIDRGFSTDGTPFAEPDHVNAETRIRAFRQAIGDSSVDVTRKAYDLAWLEHLVGDVHQPLHCVSRFSKAHRRGDRGGNLFEIVPFHIPGVSFAVDDLHALWDDALGGETTLASARALATRAEASAPSESMDVVDEGVWISESFEYAKSAAYRPLRGQPGTPAITPDYLRDVQALALRRLKLAGHRLAAVIEHDLR